jgi:hypothetical protein
MIEDGYGGYRNWLFAEENAPVRAYRLWQYVAKRRKITMPEAAAQDTLARTCRHLVLSCNWLADEEAAKL